MRHSLRCSSISIFAVIAYGQSFNLKDRNGIPVVAISDTKMFRHSTYFKSDIPDFQATAKNLTNSAFTLTINAIVHRKDGTVQTFNFIADFLAGRTVKVEKTFSEPFPYTAENFEKIEFSLSESWVSPEDARRSKAAAAARQKKAAEAEEAAAARRRKAAEEACSSLYAQTSNKRVIDLTVKEEQAVRTCQMLDLYRPK